MFDQVTENKRRSAALIAAFVIIVIVAGAAFVLAAFLVFDRTGWFRPAPNVDPRPVTARGDLMEIEKTTTAIFEKWAPSVVHITTEARARTIFGVQSYPEGTGTGFLWDASGTVQPRWHAAGEACHAAAPSAPPTRSLRQRR